MSPYLDGKSILALGEMDPEFKEVPQPRTFLAFYLAYNVTVSSKGRAATSRSWQSRSRQTKSE